MLPTASELKQKDATAYQALYGSYASASADVLVNLPAKLPAGTQMRGGDQVCSKHQLVEADAVSTNLIPNAVGSCMLKKDLPSKFADKTGTTIKYKVPGGEETDYTYGCFPDWIDTTEATATTNSEVRLCMSSAVPSFVRMRVRCTTPSSGSCRSKSWRRRR